MKKQKILLFASNSEICRDLIPKLIEKGNDIYCFQRADFKHQSSKERNKSIKYIFLNDETNIKKAKFNKLFKEWDIALFFYGDFGTIGKFHKVKYMDWEKSFKTNFFMISKILHRLIYFSEGKKMRSIINFSGSGTNGPADNYSSYTISKIALIKLTELIDSEYKNIKISTLGPGWYDSKLHNKTLKLSKQSGKNYQKTLHNIKITNNESASIRIYKFIEWFISSKKTLVSGRNFSLVHDKWGNKNLDKKLINRDYYKLRRYDNT